jgi:hypothetical protein
VGRRREGRGIMVLVWVLRAVDRGAVMAVVVVREAAVREIVVRGASIREAKVVEQA